MTTTDAPRITEAYVIPGDAISQSTYVWVRLGGGYSRLLFSYYPDEIRFTEAELVGLTMAEARALRVRKDVEWLQS